jgi:rhodanese-related sulfurtransferase
VSTAPRSRLGCVAVLLVVLVVGVAWLVVNRQNAARDTAIQNSVHQRVDAYRAARGRAGGFVLRPLAAVERIVAHPRTLVLDIRSRPEFAAVHLRGARNLPLSALLRRDGYRPPSSATVVVVDSDGTGAIEAMVLLRLGGVTAFAVQGGMNALRRLLASPRAIPRRSPVAGYGTELRALLTGEDRRALPTVSDAAGPEPARPFWVLPVVGILLLAAAGFWFGWRGCRLTRRAFALLERGDDASLRQAVALLERAPGSLPRHRATKVRFGLAYAQALLGRLDDAAATLSGLPASAAGNRAVRYLDLWLRVERDRLHDAVDLWNESEKALCGFLEGRRLASSAYLLLGREALAARDADEARRNFTKVRELGVLKGQIPEFATEYGAVVGVEKLFDGDQREAREAFRKAERSAEEDQTSPLLARIGLLLCDWRRDGAGAAAAAVGHRLGAIIEQVRADAGDPTATDEGTRPDRKRLLLRDLLLWYAVACVASWRSLPYGGGLPEEERRRLEERLAAIREVDPALSDADLLGGLVGYLMSSDQQVRNDALRMLGRACDKGVNLPEVLLMLEGRRDASVPSADGTEVCVQLLRSYLAEARAPLELRQQLRQHLGRFQRFQPLLGEDSRVADQQFPLTLSDLEARGELLELRMRGLVTRWLAETAPDRAAEVLRLLEQLDQAARSLQDGREAFERAEQRLILLAGEHLLAEEEGPK